MAKKNKLREHLINISSFLRYSRINPTDIVIPFTLTIVIALLETINASLMIPLANSLLTMKMTFNLKIPVVKEMADLLVSRATSFRAAFVILVVAVFVTSLLKSIVQYSNSLILSRQFLSFSYKLKNIIFQRYLSFGKLFFDKTNQGYLSDLISSYTNSLVGQLMGLQGLLLNFLLFVTYTVIMILISWQMTIFVIIVYTLQHKISKIVQDKIHRNSSQFVIAQQEVSKQIFNILSCIPLVKACNKEKEEEERFFQLSNCSRSLQFRIDKKTKVLGPFYEMSMQVTLLSLLVATVFLLTKTGRGNLPLFLVFFYVAKKSSGSFGAILSFNVAIASASGIMSRIMEIFDDKGKYFIKDGTKEFPGLSRSIELRNLSFSYGEGAVEVLKGVTFTIEKGKMTAIVGPTGAGKTTIINLILRFYECPASSIFFDGTDIKDFTASSLRSHISSVSQDTQLFNSTIKYNIAYGARSQVSDEEIVNAVNKSQLREFIAKLPSGLETHVGDRGIKLSGGEKQRVSIARALLKNTEILILDEATSALDSKTETLIQQALEELVKDRTSIVIAHRLSTIKNANKIVVIEHGGVVEQGSLRELLDSKGKFYEYWQEQKFF